MKRLLICCLKSQASENNQKEDYKDKHSSSQMVEGVMESSEMTNANDPNSKKLAASATSLKKNIIVNHDFSQGLHFWHPNCCDGFVSSRASGDLGCPDEMSAKSGGNYAVLTNRKECWQGLEQEITSSISAGSTYIVVAQVGVSGPLQGLADVLATLKLEWKESETKYFCIGRTTIPKGTWGKIDGQFALSAMPDRVVFYLEGPSPGVDLLVQSAVITCLSPAKKNKIDKGVEAADGNIILNPTFDDGLNNWSARGCKIVTQDSMGDGKILPKSGIFFASATERTQSWNGIQQEITGRVQRKLAYNVTAIVRIFGNNVTSTNVQATLYVQTSDLRDQYIGISNVPATDKDWTELEGKFLINSTISKVIIYLEGPPAGTEILLNSLVVKHAEKVPPSTPPEIETPSFRRNIIENSDLANGTNGWFPLGSCTLSVGSGAPRIIPPMASDSLGAQEPLSGRCILVTNRTQTWMGPAQMITERLKLYLTYQISSWIRVANGVTGPQNVNVAVSVDDQWVNGGQIEISDDNRWHEIRGSFRIEMQPANVMVYFQGPASGVDLMVAGLQIFAVDRKARFKHLRRQTDKVRKRYVTLKFSGTEASSMTGTLVRVKQTQNNFPLGTCINRISIDNEDFVDFFVKHFNWGVFENELKWYWTEAQQGNLNYKDADDLLTLCTSHNIDVRGHCIFWEAQGSQSWIQSLNSNDLAAAVQNRLTSLLTRYKGKFKHYDVNNEMLHGSFYQDRLGKDTRANMFKTTNQLDPSSLLFVNDYHVEDGNDPRSSPESYIEQIVGLQKQGASIGGIGIQGHIDSPIGPIVCSALDKLGTLGLPIWFTEVDVSSINEYVRADDLEVMLREAFAHPAVEGIVLWGFWELSMSRNNSHLVNAEGDINEAGKRYLELKQEWLSHAHGHIDEQGEFKFRGFQGTYEVEITSHSKKISKTFAVDKDSSTQVIPIDL